MKKYTKDRSTSCLLCNKQFSTKYHIKRHVDTVHRKLRPFSCTICRKSFGEKRTLNNHLIVHTRKKKQKRSHPPPIHINVVHESKKKSHPSPIRISVVPESIRTNSDLDSGLKDELLSQHEIKSEMPSKMCSEPFLLTGDVKTNLIHRGPKTFLCKICNKSLPSKQDLSLHFEVIHCEKMCAMCGNFFKRTQIKNHMWACQAKLPCLKRIDNLCVKTEVKSEIKTEFKGGDHSQYDENDEIKAACISKKGKNGKKPNLFQKCGMCLRMFHWTKIVKHLWKCKARFPCLSEFVEVKGELLKEPKIQKEAKIKNTHQCKVGYNENKLYVYASEKFPTHDGQLEEERRIKMSEIGQNNSPSILKNDIPETSGLSDCVDCTKCPKLSRDQDSSENNGDRHIDAVHKNPLTFSDMSFSKSFSETENPDYHDKALPKNSVPKKVNQFSCSICRKLFIGKLTLNEHISVIHKNEKELEKENRGNEKLKPYCCNLCKKSFSYLRTLIRHVMDFHKNPQLFPCMICQKTFSKKDNLRQHTNTIHRNIRPFRCRVCHHSFARKDVRNRHLNQVHKLKGPLKLELSTESPSCDVVRVESLTKLSEYQPMLTDSQSTLTESQSTLAESQSVLVESQSTLGESQYKLDQSRSKLKRLGEFKSKVDESQFKLNESYSKSDKSQSRLVESQLNLAESQSKLGESQSKLDESQPKQAESQSWLDEFEFKLDAIQLKPGESHSKLDGIGPITESLFLCDNLEPKRENSSRQDYISETDDTASEPSESPSARHGEGEISLGSLSKQDQNAKDEKDIFSSTLCNTSFGSGKALTEKPLTEQPLTKKQFDCSLCLKKFYSMKNVERHINTVHKKLRLFSCRFCGKSFAESRNLNRHMLTLHKFPCHVCRRLFQSKGLLDRHFHKFHPRWTCTSCKKTFPHKSALFEHMRLHAKDTQKPFTCPLCENHFYTTSQVEDHIYKIHHNTNIFSCTNCEESFTEKWKYERHKYLNHGEFDTGFITELHKPAQLAQSHNTSPSEIAAKSPSVPVGKPKVRIRVALQKENTSQNNIQATKNNSQNSETGETKIFSMQRDKRTTISDCDELCLKQDEEVKGFEWDRLLEIGAHCGMNLEKDVNLLTDTTDRVIKSEDDFFPPSTDGISQQIKTSTESSMNLNKDSNEAGLEPSNNYAACTKCHKVFMGQEYLAKHMKLKHPETQESKVIKNEIIATTRTNTKSIQCSVCEEGFTNVTDYTHHLNVHLEENLFSGRINKNVKIIRLSMADMYGKHG